MIEVTNLLATKQYIVKRENETNKVQVVPQMVSTLRKELTFWGDYEGLDFFELVIPVELSQYDNCINN